MKILVKLILLILITSLVVACSKKPNAAEVKKFINTQLDNMVFVRQGSFQMGPGPKKQQWIAPNNQPRHTVTVSSYYISKYLVTYSDYDNYTNINNLPLVDQEAKKSNLFYRSPDHPITGVSWYQANDYCQYLAKAAGFPFDLPTEAQWEYAARSRGLEIIDATNTGTRIEGVNTASMQQYENQPGHLTDSPFPLPVGKFPPNPLGLYDMTEIFQWMKNWNYNYPATPEINPQGLATGTEKMVRGQQDLIYNRDGVDPDMQDETVGFRCVINSDKPMSELKAIALKNLQ